MSQICNNLKNFNVKHEIWIAKIAIIWSHFRNISWFSFEYNAIKFQNVFVLISIILNTIYICWFLEIAIWFFFSQIFNNVDKLKLSNCFRSRRRRKTLILIKYDCILFKTVELIENVFNNFDSYKNDFLRKSIMIHSLRFLKRFRNIQFESKFCIFLLFSDSTSIARRWYSIWKRIAISIFSSSTSWKICL